jgi:hypothetical protein
VNLSSGRSREPVNYSQQPSPEKSYKNQKAVNHVNLVNDFDPFLPLEKDFDKHGISIFFCFFIV